MPTGFQVSEETPDREYFTIVPNYIINHSTIWERDIYLIMKRIAGEKGSCYASHQTIAEKTGVSRPTISRTIKKLLKRGWIKETGKVAGKTHPTKNYVIVDLWQLNTEFYQEKKRKLQNQSIENKKDTSTTEPKIRKPQIHKEDLLEEDNKISIYNTNTKPNGFGKPELNKGMEFLLELRGKPINKVSLNRFALNRLVKKHGLDRSCRALKFAFGVVEDEFAPAITDYISLERKWENLEIYARRKMKKANAADIQGSIERGKQIGDIT